MLRAAALLGLGAALLLAGCSGEEDDPGLAGGLTDAEMAAGPDAPGADGAREGGPELEGTEGRPDDDGPAIRVYLTDMDEFGELSGLTMSRDEFLDLRIAVEDADGDPVPDVALQVSSLVGNEISESGPTTDASGEATLRFRPILPGEDTLTVTGNELSRQITIYISDERFGHPVEHMEERATELPDVAGTLSWDRIGAVDTREGEYGMLEPLFDDGLRELDGREVKVQGFMLPLGNDEEQDHFLLTRTPPSCFYCLPGGPESVVEVRTEQPLAFSFDPVIISGRMSLLEDNDMGLFYRLDNGERITPADD